jgi:MFS family permease
VGSALGYLLGGWIGSTWSWRHAFYVVGLPGLLVGLAAYGMREPVRGSSEEVEQKQLDTFLARGVKLRDYLRILRIRSFLLNTAGMTAYTYSIGGISYWMPTFLNQERRIPLAKANFQFGLVTVATGIVGTLAGGALADRLARRVRGAYFLVCGLSMLAASPFFYLAVKHDSPTIYWACLVIAELLIFLNTGPSNTVLVNVTLPNIRTTAFALNIFIIHALGDVLSPPIMGAIADRSNLTAAFLSTTGVVVLSGLLWSAGTPFLGPALERRHAVPRPGHRPGQAADERDVQRRVRRPTNNRRPSRSSGSGAGPPPGAPAVLQAPTTRLSFVSVFLFSGPPASSCRGPQTGVLPVGWQAMPVGQVSFSSSQATLQKRVPSTGSWTQRPPGHPWEPSQYCPTEGPAGVLAPPSCEPGSVPWPATHTPPVQS